MARNSGMDYCNDGEMEYSNRSRDGLFLEMNFLDQGSKRDLTGDPVHP
jgi:hypothetical protein